MKPLKILIACEFSGIVRDAFTALGHDATSCDLLPTEKPGKHYQGDVLDILNDGWDMMIAHPPCTFISYAGTQVWDKPGRARLRLEALDFFLTLWEAPIEKICLENPMGCASPVIAKYHQMIHPYYFGDEDLKRTCLWLKNLPLLQYQMRADLFSERTASERPEPVYIDNTPRKKKRYFTDGISGNGQKERSKTFPGIANAMASQWGGDVNSKLLNTA